MRVVAVVAVVTTVIVIFGSEPRLNKNWILFQIECFQRSFGRDFHTFCVVCPFRCAYPTSEQTSTAVLMFSVELFAILITIAVGYLLDQELKQEFDHIFKSSGILLVMSVALFIVRVVCCKSWRDKITARLWHMHTASTRVSRECKHTFKTSENTQIPSTRFARSQSSLLGRNFLSFRWMNRTMNVKHTDHRISGAFAIRQTHQIDTTFEKERPTLCCSTRRCEP